MVTLFRGRHSKSYIYIWSNPQDLKKMVSPLNMTKHFLVAHKETLHISTTATFDSASRLCTKHHRWSCCFPLLFCFHCLSYLATSYFPVLSLKYKKNYATKCFSCDFSGNQNKCMCIFKNLRKKHFLTFETVPEFALHFFLFTWGHFRSFPKRQHCSCGNELTLHSQSWMQLSRASEPIQAWVHFYILRIALWVNLLPWQIGSGDFPPFPSVSFIRVQRTKLDP